MNKNNRPAGWLQTWLRLCVLAFTFWIGSSVAQSPAGVYYVHTDHLNTPRAITNQVGQTVWSWENTDPFGANAPNENPGGLGTFTCNMRLPGQYFDKETNLHYNYFRDYDPQTGRYVQADPLGVFTTKASTGLTRLNSIYGYVDVNPLGYSDRYGLWRDPRTIYDDALEDAARSGLPGRHNGLQDAYRHCLASCEMARENTAVFAQCLGWANEKTGDWLHNQQAGERRMDDVNNAIGVGLAKSAKSPQDCRAACMDAVRSGRVETYSSGTTRGYWY